MRLQISRPPLQIHWLVHFQPHGLVSERACRCLGIAIEEDDAHGIAVVLKQVHGIFQQLLARLGPVLVESDADVHIAHVLWERMAIQQQRPLAQVVTQFFADGHSKAAATASYDWLGLKGMEPWSTI